jgi:two-component system, NarL family, response regulator DevR
MTRVFVVDDHELVRRAFGELFRKQEDLELAGEAASVGEILGRLDKIDADVFVLELRLPDGSGVELCREIRSRRPQSACLILSMFRDEDALLEAVMAGAAGYLLKDTPASDLLAGIRKAARGQSLLDAATTARLVSRVREAAPGQEGQPRLTEREERILDLVAEGLTNRQIAGRLHLAEQTVKNYVSRLLRKLGVESRTQAAIYAERRRSSRDRT